MNCFNEKIKRIHDDIPHIKSEKRTNTIAHIFGKDSNENFVSDELSFLITPEEFGDERPLVKMLECAGTVVRLENVKVTREYVMKDLEDGRRIDFLIETDDAIIGIENKIWSGLGDVQLHDYSVLLDRMAFNRKVVKILLYPQRNEGVTKEIECGSLNGFIPVTYERLIHAFKQIGLDTISDDISRFILNDFIKHIEDYLLKETQMLNMEKLEWANKYREEITDIENLVLETKKAFECYVDSRIFSLLEKETLSEWTISRSSHYYQLYNPEWKYKSDEGVIHFELLCKPKGIFPPKAMEVALHTNEIRRIERTEKLQSLEMDAVLTLINRYDGVEFAIDYENGEKGFEASMDVIFEALELIIRKYSSQVTDEWSNTQTLNE